MAKIKKNYLKPKVPGTGHDLGRLVAENDDSLDEYYVGTERYVSRAMNVEDPAVFFIGPKGVGKSAILQMVQLLQTRNGSRVIEIRPDDLAFSSLALATPSSPVIGEAGKHQWLFKTLWDYALSLEVLKREYPDSSEMGDWLLSFFRGRYEKEARKLVSISQRHKVSLTDRILQLVDEIQFSGEQGGTTATGGVKLRPANTGSEDSTRLLSLVNSVARHLRENLKHRYYILIDDLDLYWDNSEVQNAFIAALFSSLSHISRPPFLKAAVALRENIYNCLPIVDRDKSPDSICKVSWTKNSVKEMVENRVSHKFNATQGEVWSEVFPAHAFDEIYQHSTGRPREVIRLEAVSKPLKYDK